MKIYTESFGRLSAMKLSCKECVQYSRIGKNRVLVRGKNGYYAWVLSEKVISLLTDCNEQKIDVSEILREKEGDKLMTRAIDVISVSRGPSYELQSTDGTVIVHVQKKFIKKFPGCEFYANAPDDRILVKEPRILHKTVGIILPFVVHKEDTHA